MGAEPSLESSRVSCNNAGKFESRRETALMNAEAPILRAKDAPDLGAFNWEDPLNLR
jgi:hypothetical protein